MVYVQRRERLLRLLDQPALLFSGSAISRNYPANTYPFRADSSFLYFFSCSEPGSAAFFDPADLTVTLFLPRRTIDDALWHGATESFADAHDRHGVHAVLAMEDLEREVAARAKGRPVDSLAVADHRATQRARAVTGQPLSLEGPLVGRPELLLAIARLRMLKDQQELRHIAEAVAVTREVHLAAMRRTRAGVREQTLAGVVEGTMAEAGCVPAYGTILSVRGEVLHNHAHGNVLRSGDMLLLDAGAEVASTGYCADVTRCWPVDGFSPEAGDVYEAVLAAQVQAIEAVRPGVRFRDLHLLASRVLAERLVAMGLLKGSADGLVESGAHAVFFPHGLGHQLGLDVHDLEAFGDLVHYPDGRQRSQQFGLRYLRMDMDLQAGMTFTIEPGLYFVPAIIHSEELRNQFKDQVNWALAERFLTLNDGRGLGGVRIEDDVLCTPSGSSVLTASIPKLRAEVDALVGTA
jgi:Xaa-Pro aminopeptidase